MLSSANFYSDLPGELFDFTATELTTETAASRPVGMLWRDFKSSMFVEAERILFGLRRGNVGMLVAETETGKTTIALNLSLTLAANRTFTPIVAEKSGGRKVMYVDGESTRAEFKEDVKHMTSHWSSAERALLDENLFVLCDEEVDEELLDLARPYHSITVSEAARQFKPDLIIVDTLAALFSLEDENSNAEVKKKVMQPLKQIAKEANAALLLLHHIGKPKMEEGHSTSHAYRGRGASNFGCLSRSVVTLSAPNRTDRERVVLSVPKGKGYRPPDVTLRLDPQTRWFAVEGKAAVAEPTSLAEIVRFITQEVRTKDVVKAFEGKYSKRTVEDKLKAASKRELISKSRRGWYAPKDSASSAEPNSDCGNCGNDEEEQQTTLN